MASSNFTKRSIKDSVFTSLFKEKKYSLELYKALNPDVKDVTENDIKIVTTNTTLVNDLYNDLSITVKKTVIFLMEAQSVWCIIIVWRIFLYLANYYKNYFDENGISLYKDRNVILPMPELYVVYTGDQDITQDEISLNDIYFGGKGQIDVKVKVITKNNYHKYFKDDNNVLVEV